MSCTAVLLALSVSVLVWLLTDYWRKWRHLGHLSGFYSFPSSIFNILLVRTKAHEFFEDMLGITVMFRKPKLVVLWVFTKPYILLWGPKEIEAVLSSAKHTKKGYIYTMYHPWLGRGLFTSDGDHWRRLRKLMSPSFHHQILHDFIPIFNEQARLLVTKLSQLDHSQPTAMDEHMSLCALDVICETSLGIKVHAQIGREKKFVHNIHDFRINEIIHQRQRYPWLWLDWLFKLLPIGRRHDQLLKEIHGFSDKVIRERLKSRIESDSQDQRAFLDRLLALYEQGDLGMNQIRSEVNTMLLAGHDTTSVGIVWTLFLLGCHPQWQIKVQNELDQVFGDSDLNITNDDLRELPLLTRCFQEALRLYPSVPEFTRLIEEDLKAGTTVIPRGSEVIIFAYGLHHDPDVWAEPYTYNPDRFLPENRQGRNPYDYIPFSAGYRNCIGQKYAMLEVRIILAWILRYFSFESIYREDQLVLTQMTTLRPNTPQHRMFVRPRRELSADLTLQLQNFLNE